MTASDWSDLPLVLTTEQAAAVLQVNRRTIANMLDRGDLRGMKIGKEWRVSRAEVRRFVERPRPPLVQFKHLAADRSVARLVMQGNVLVAQVGHTDDLTDAVERERERRLDELFADAEQ